MLALHFYLDRIGFVWCVSLGHRGTPFPFGGSGGGAFHIVVVIDASHVSTFFVAKKIGQGGLDVELALVDLFGDPFVAPLLGPPGEIRLGWQRTREEFLGLLLQGNPNGLLPRRLR